jgi:hypothetical protein
MDVPTVVDFRVHDREGVFPMVPAGRPNDEISLGPEFTAEEQQAAARRELRGGAPIAAESREALAG